MVGFKLVSFLAVLALVAAQDYQDYQNVRPAPQRLAGPSAPKPTPVPILKQINRHNEDGSYTYGYEGADGSFKIETKLATGEVKGKYGYVDETGKVRVVEYGANKYGFQPAGEGITVAPPTLVDETTRKDGTANPEYDDGSYYQPQSATPAPRPQIARVNRPQPRPQPQYQDYDQYEPQQPAQPQYRPAPQPQPQPQYRPAPVPPRAQISGAAPTGIVYSPQQRPARPEPVSSYQAPLARQHSFGSALPAPVRQEQQEQLFTQARPAPQQIDFRPAPQPIAYAQPAPRPRPSGGGGGGVLDQLARDYALPEGGVPLHDISFGYY